MIEHLTAPLLVAFGYLALRAISGPFHLSRRHRWTLGFFAAMWAVDMACLAYFGAEAQIGPWFWPIAAFGYIYGVSDTTRVFDD